VTTPGGRRRASTRTLLAVVLTVITATLALLATLGVAHEKSVYLRSLEDKGVLMTETLQEPLADALYFGDIKRLRHLTEALQTQPEVIAYEVFGGDGRLLVDSEASRFPAGAIDSGRLADLATAERAIVLRVGQQIEVVMPVRVGGRLLGGVLLRLSPTEWPAQRRALALRYTSLGAVALLLAVGLALALSRAFRATEHLSESERRLRQLAESMREVLWLRDLESGHVLYLSPACEEVFGEPRVDVLANPATRLRRLHPEDAGGVERLINAEPPENYEIEYRLREADGANRWIFERITLLIDHDGRPYRAVGAAEDITQRKELEADLLQSQKMDSLGRLAGGIAHDFNNLLTGVLGFATLGETRRPEPDVAEHHFRQIRQAAERGGKLTQQLLSFARRQVVHPRVVNLNDLLREIEELLRRVLGEDIELVTKAARELGNVRVDPGQFEQVVMNLVVNAREAMPDGGRLTIETTNTDVDLGGTQGRTLDQQDCVSITVTDTGVGIPEEVAGRVFEPFFSTKDQGGGTGLGLAICYGIVNQSGGDIRVDGREGIGTRMQILLPRVRAAAEDSRELVLPVIAIPRGGTALIAEDETDVRAVMKAVLDEAGFEVIAAADGPEALRLEREHEGPIHLLVTDVVMPKMRGPQLAKRLRERHPNLRVLFVSGYTEESFSARDLAEEDIAFLAKPFAPHDLLRRVRELSIVRPG